MLYRMTIMTSLAERRTDVHARVPHVRRRATAATVRLRLLDGAASDGQLSGAVRHAVEVHGSLTSAQRLSLTAPSDLPRLYTPSEADALSHALLAAGARLAALPGTGS